MYHRYIFYKMYLEENLKLEMPFYLAIIWASKDGSSSGWLFTLALFLSPLIGQQLMSDSTDFLSWCSCCSFSLNPFFQFSPEWSFLVCNLQAPSSLFVPQAVLWSQSLSSPLSFRDETPGRTSFSPALDPATNLPFQIVKKKSIWLQLSW